MRNSVHLPAIDGQKLNRDIIVDEALALLCEIGLDGISLRRLAERLGVRAPSLYWHFPDKNALLCAMTEQIFATYLEHVPDHRDWRPWMRDFGRELLRAQEEIPDFGRLVTTPSIPADQFARTTARINQKLATLDMPVAEAVNLQSAIQALVMGWSAFSHAPYADKINIFIDLENVALASLDALIDGWSRRTNDA